MDVAEFLSTVPGFRGISTEDLERIACGATVCEYADGEHLIHRGAPGDTMHVICSGHVRVPILGDDGEEKLVVRLGPRKLVGEMALLTGEVRSADVIAEEPVRTVAIDRATLLPVLDENPRLAAFLTEILGRRLEQGGGIDRLGQYRLLDKLGEGSTGRVFRALHGVLSRVVAIKMLPHELVHHGDFRERFIHEARVIARLEHPHIVRVYDTASAYGTWYIVMEYLEGSDLAALLERDGRLPWPEAARILRQVGSALACAHAEGFAHRDVKPANVAIDARGVVKLMDFGLAQPLEHHTDANKEVGGTPYYLAPEAAAGQAVDGRADVYSLGVMAFEMVAGRRPFEADNVLKLLAHHIHKSPPDIGELAPGIPRELARFIEGALVKDPEARLSDWSVIDGLLCACGEAAGAGAGAAPGVVDELELEQVVRLRYPLGSAAAVDGLVDELVQRAGEREGVQIERSWEAGERVGVSRGPRLADPAVSRPRVRLPRES